MIGPSVVLLLLAGPSPGAVDGGDATVVLRGRVLCLDPGLRPIAPPGEDSLCNEPGAARFAFATSEGERLLFLADDPRSQMFLDPEVRDKELVVEGWRRPEGRFELLHVYSIKEGRLHDLHYRCDRCNITAAGPGPCWCCGQPFELREAPLEGDGLALSPGEPTRPGVKR